MTLRSRLALLFGLVALAVSAVVGVSSYQATSSEVEASTDAFLEARATELADGNRESPRDRNDGRPNGNGNDDDGGNDGGDGDDGDGDDAGDPPVLAFDPDAVVQTTNKDGVVDGSSGIELPITDAVLRMIEAEPGNDRRDVGVFEDITIDGESFRMYTLAQSSGGAIQVAQSTEADDSVLQNLLTRFGLIALVVTVVASLLGWWIARRTTRPLRRLADVASTVADTRDFSIEVPVERSDEIGTLATSLRTMLTALETSRRQQRSLVQDASHELRTPLTSLRANVALLERIERSPGNVSAEDRSAVLEAISAETAELGSLFDELVDLATNNDDRDAPLEPMRLDEVVRHAAHRWEQRTDRVIELRTEPVEVLGNETLLERAVTNLIGNAHKFSPPGETIEVVVEAITTGDSKRSTTQRACVAVRDGGPGIPEADRPYVFNRFHRAESTRGMPGSGLGLAIVAQIVDHHGGTVWADESDRGGADVGFSLEALRR